MVSQRTAAGASSRDRILAAATVEFAARGFDGAKVDRIATRARVNKAMLYYHFTNKAALYRAILADVFGSLAAAVAAGRQEGAAPQAEISRFIRAIAAESATHRHFPPIWLREMAEGGRHLDASVIRQLGAILSVLRSILADGQRLGIFREAHPLVVQMGIVAPLLLFSASAPVRERFSQSGAGEMADIERETVIAHVEASTLAALQIVPATRPAPESPAQSRPSRGRRQRS